jgi:hypothetical protein
LAGKQHSGDDRFGACMSAGTSVYGGGNINKNGEAVRQHEPTDG